MPDTAVLKTSDGWIDVAQPAVFHSCRRLARDARRQGRPVGTPSARRSARPIVIRSTGPSVLQQRLLDRLPTQGATLDETAFVVLEFGYNKAASYGHMRAAGANHSEALNVVALDSSQISVIYGMARGRGLGHTAAFAEALQ